MVLRISSIVIFILLTGLLPVRTQSAAGSGAIRGKIVDADTQAPLAGVNVSVLHTILGASSDIDGSFLISEVPAGSYTLSFDYLGYAPAGKTDVIVRSRRITVVDMDMRPTVIDAEAVTVTAGYFSEGSSQPLSLTRFSQEEIRRAPGSAGDVSRILMSLPSVAKVNDQSNSLIVRGGSPVENAFYVDNIEIPNINHFPTQGSSGGPIGLINVDFIKEVDFSAGGFPARYGNRLSSVMELSFREGNRSEFDGQLDLNFAGFGGAAEGPLGGGKGSWLFSARRSYLDLLIKAIDTGTSIAPRYGDYQGKLVYDLHPRHQLTLLGIFGDDHSHSDREAAQENDMTVYGTQDYGANTAGLNWRMLWTGKGFSNTSLSYSGLNFREDYFENGSDIRVVRNRSSEQAWKLRNLNHFRLGPHALEFGFEAQHRRAGFDNRYAAFSDALGDSIAPQQLTRDINARQVGGFASLTLQLLPRFTATAGLRGDYFSAQPEARLSPRLALSYQLSQRTTLSGSAGRYHQPLPVVLLVQQAENHDLPLLQATHYVLRISHLLSADTRLSVEAYRKDYRHFPLDPAQPALFLIDEIFYRYGFFFHHGPLNDEGQAASRGIEIMLQKKLADKVYGLVSASYFRSEYRGGDGRWRERVFDNRYIFSAEGGYKPNRSWEFSLRWIYAGGAPYTPFDETASRTQQRGVLAEAAINSARYPDYHSLNLRFDRRFQFDRANMVFYFSVWNAYNRRNIAGYYWNITENRPDEITQWGVLPIFGLEFEY